MPEVKRYKVTEPYLDIHCGLGEAPFWDKKSHTLRFVDIVKKQLHTVDLDKGPESHKTFQLDISVGTTANIQGNDEEFVFGGKAGYGIMNKKTAAWKYIKKMWTAEEESNGFAHRMRSNDGSVDSMGRYWVGTMNDPIVVDEPGPEGKSVQAMMVNARRHSVTVAESVRKELSFVWIQTSAYIVW